MDFGFATLISLKTGACFSFHDGSITFRLYLGPLCYINSFIYIILHQNSMMFSWMDDSWVQFRLKKCTVWDAGCLCLWAYISDWYVHRPTCYSVCVDNMLYYIGIFYAIIEIGFEIYECRPIAFGRNRLGIGNRIMVLIW